MTALRTRPFRGWISSDADAQAVNPANLEILAERFAPFGYDHLSLPSLPPEDAAVVRPYIPAAGLGTAERRSLVTRCALDGAPLVLSGDLAALDDDAYAVLTDPEILACHASGLAARLIGEAPDVEIRHTPGREAWTGWIGAFNRGVTTADVRIELPTPGARVLDVWDGGYSRFYDQILAGVAPGDVLFLKYGISTRPVGRDGYPVGAGV